jgi:hypothetical protein
LKSIFILEPEANTALFEKGYVKIPFFKDEELLYLKKVFQDVFFEQHQSEKAFHTTYETRNKELISAVNQVLQPLFLEKAKQYFTNFEPISAGFLVKESGINSECPMHQDAQFVDERTGYSLSVWVPLQDCNEVNGGLQFVPYSHLTNTGIRAWPYDNAHIGVYQDELQPMLTLPTIKAGEAFVFFNSTIHASMPNQSGIQRPVAVMSFFSKGSQLSIFKHVGDQIIGYEISPRDLMSINDTLQLEKAIETIRMDADSNKPAVKMGLLKELNSLKAVKRKPRSGWRKLFLELFYKW